MNIIKLVMSGCPHINKGWGFELEHTGATKHQLKPTEVQQCTEDSIVSLVNLHLQAYKMESLP